MTHWHEIDPFFAHCPAAKGWIRALSEGDGKTLEIWPNMRGWSDPSAWSERICGMEDFLGLIFFIQHCFFCRPSDSTVSEDVGIKASAVATLA